MDLKDVSTQSAEIRSRYHDLERQIHGSVWSVEEDALAFLTDAGLVGRFTMDNQGRWPSEDKELLPSKIGECVWWLAVLAERMELDFAACGGNDDNSCKRTEYNGCGNYSFHILERITQRFLHSGIHRDPFTRTTAKVYTR